MFFSIFFSPPVLLRNGGIQEIAEHLASSQGCLTTQPYCSHCRTPQQSRWVYLTGSCSSWIAHGKIGSWKCLWSMEWSPCRSSCPTEESSWSSLFLEGCSPWEVHTLQQFLRAAAHGQDPHWSRVCSLYPVKGMPCWKLKRVLGEGSGRNYDWSQSSFSILLLFFLGNRQKDQEWSCTRGEGRGRGKVLLICIYVLLS